VAGQGKNGQSSIPVQVKRALDFPLVEGIIPVGPEISLSFIFRPFGPSHFLPRNEESGLREELIAAGMVEVEMGVHYAPNIFRPQSDGFQLTEDSRAFIPQGFEGLGQPSPPGDGVLKNAGVGAGVEKKIALGMTDDENRHRPHDHFLPGSIGDKNILSTAKRTATQGIESHPSFPFLLRFSFILYQIPLSKPPNFLLDPKKSEKGF
jgi:hypothetical protein